MDHQTVGRSSHRPIILFSRLSDFKAFYLEKTPQKVWKFIEVMNICNLRYWKLCFQFSSLVSWMVHEYIVKTMNAPLESTCIYGHLRWPFFLPFGYGRVLELFRMTNIWNGNNLEGMTIFGRNDTNPEGMTIIWKEWQ